MTESQRLSEAVFYTLPYRKCSHMSLNPAVNPGDIFADAVRNGYGFLPGARPSSDDFLANLSLPILIGGLDYEEVVLILSALPKGAERIYLSSLDKGLSGAKVFAVRYGTSGTQAGRVFVLKIGKAHKIQREVAAIQSFVRPHIYGISEPIQRYGPAKGLLIQDYAGLSARSTLRSLREFIREGNRPAKVIKLLLEDRFSGWYKPKRHPVHSWSLGELFKWYLAKGNDPNLAPVSWGSIDEWLCDVSGVRTLGIHSAVLALTDHRITALKSIVHGDLHCQNILVDEHDHPWAIDFAWCHDGSSPLIDALMLECSLKFLVVPKRTDPRQLLRLERSLASEAFPALALHDMPYAAEVKSALEGVIAAREFAMSELAISFDDYLKGLFILTWALRRHEGLNQPLVIGSLAVIADVLGFV